MTNPSAIKSARDGFTLVEVALAVLAVGLGLMTIIGLFPAGLQNASDDAADTRAGLFAGAVFSAMRGTATETNVTVWDDGFLENLNVEGMALTFDGAAYTLRYPATATDTPENYLRYKVSVVEVAGAPGKTYGVTLSTCDGRYGPFKAQNSFYTEFYYTGM
jgi:Tfp pilus assembly protein PilV